VTLCGVHNLFARHGSDSRAVRRSRAAQFTVLAALAGSLVATAGIEATDAQSGLPFRAIVPIIATDAPRPTPTPTSPAGPVAAEVSIQGSDFVPASVTIRAGEAVRWTHNDAGLAHSVVHPFGNSARGTAGLVYTFTFTRPGTHAYFCGIHPNMAAEVIVLP
jgi:plastocyanin